MPKLMMASMGCAKNDQTQKGTLWPLPGMIMLDGKSSFIFLKRFSFAFSLVGNIKKKEKKKRK